MNAQHAIQRTVAVGMQAKGLLEDVLHELKGEDLEQYTKWLEGTNNITHINNLSAWLHAKGKKEESKQPTTSTTQKEQVAGSNKGAGVQQSNVSGNDSAGEGERSTSTEADSGKDATTKGFGSRWGKSIYTNRESEAAI